VPNPSLQRTLLKLRSLEKQKHQLSRRGQRRRGGSLKEQIQERKEKRGRKRGEIIPDTKKP